MKAFLRYQPLTVPTSSQTARKACKCREGMEEQYFGCCHLQSPCLNPKNKPEGLWTDALKEKKKKGPIHRTGQRKVKISKKKQMEINSQYIMVIMFF